MGTDADCWKISLYVFFTDDPGRVALLVLGELVVSAPTLQHTQCLDRYQLSDALGKGNWIPHIWIIVGGSLFWRGCF
jgi:hypothetical protein